MTRQLDPKRLRMLREQIGANTQWQITINDTTGAEIDYRKRTGTFSIDILELPFDNVDKGLGRYSHGFPPCLLPTAVRLLKAYVKEHGNNFDSLKQYELQSGNCFSNYFEQKTGIPYHDIVIYEP